MCWQSPVRVFILCLAPLVLTLEQTSHNMAAKKSVKSAAESATPETTAKPAAKKAAKKAAKTVTKAAKTAATKAPAKALSKEAAPAPAKKSVKPSLDAIARAAYLNYRRRVEQGLPGDSHGDWLEAERQMSQG
jgi:hypothetical protein